MYVFVWLVICILYCACKTKKKKHGCEIRVSVLLPSFFWGREEGGKFDKFEFWHLQDNGISNWVCVLFINIIQ